MCETRLFLYLNICKEHIIVYKQGMEINGITESLKFYLIIKFAHIKKSKDA